jgi:hypothetical protein
MKISFRALFMVLGLSIGLVACDEDTSISSSNGGSLTGDGGVRSAQYAGTYRGNTHIEYSGDDVNGNDDLPTSLTINTDGTVSVTIEGETVDGVINGNQIDIRIKITRTEDGIKCKGDASITATVQGASVSGPVSGDAECKLLTIERNADLSGSISASKQ